MTCLERTITHYHLDDDTTPAKIRRIVNPGFIANLVAVGIYVAIFHKKLPSQCMVICNQPVEDTILIICLSKLSGSYPATYLRTYNVTVYTVIFEGRKFRGFCCKLAECKILILEKKQ